MTQDKFLTVPSSHKCTVLSVSRLHLRPVKGNHVCPDLINIGLACKIHHIRRKSATWAHIYLKTDDITLSSKTLLVFLQAEKLKMYEAAPYIETFDRGHGLPA